MVVINNAVEQREDESGTSPFKGVWVGADSCCDGDIDGFRRFECSGGSTLRPTSPPLIRRVKRGVVGSPDVFSLSHWSVVTPWNILYWLKDVTPFGQSICRCQLGASDNRGSSSISETTTSFMNRPYEITDNASMLPIISMNRIPPTHPRLPSVSISVRSSMPSDRSATSVRQHPLLTNYWPLL